MFDAHNKLCFCTRKNVSPTKLAPIACYRWWGQFNQTVIDNGKSFDWHVNFVFFALILVQSKGRLGVTCFLFTACFCLCSRIPLGLLLISSRSGHILTEEQGYLSLSGQPIYSGLAGKNEDNNHRLFLLFCQLFSYCCCHSRNSH